MCYLFLPILLWFDEYWVEQLLQSLLMELPEKLGAGPSLCQSLPCIFCLCCQWQQELAGAEPLGFLEPLQEDQLPGRDPFIARFISLLSLIIVSYHYISFKFITKACLRQGSSLLCLVGFFFFFLSSFFSSAMNESWGPGSPVPVKAPEVAFRHQSPNSWSNVRAFCLNHGAYFICL